MALLHPVYGLIVPFLFVVTIPLAILAGITTTLAFSVLMFRVAVVYIDIAVNMVPQYVTGRRMYPFPRGYASSLISRTAAARSDLPPPPPPPLFSPADPRAALGSGQTTPSPTNRPPVRHHRRRRTSAGSFHSVGSMTSTEDNTNTNNVNSGAMSKRNSWMMIPSVGFDRDFEGVGGWRFNNGKHPDDDDDDAWTQLNSRLELPLDRHHHRSPSGGGAITPGGGGAGDFLMMKMSPRAKEKAPEVKRGRERKQAAMSPNSSRQRTPTSGLPPAPPPLTTMDQAESGGGSYFPPVSPRSARRVF